MTSPPHQSGGRGTYICDPCVCIETPVGHRAFNNGSGMCWHLDTYARLSWQYGPDRAMDMVEGRDAATEADLRAWRELGS